MARRVLGAKPDSLSLVSGTTWWKKHYYCEQCSDLYTSQCVHTDRQTDRRLGDRHPSWHLDDRQTSKCKDSLTSVYLVLESDSGSGCTSKVCLLPSAGIKGLCHYALDVQIVYRTQQNTCMYLPPCYKGYFKNVNNQSGEEKLRASLEVSQVLCSMDLECTTILACRQDSVQLSHVSQYIACSTLSLWVSVQTL